MIPIEVISDLHPAQFKIYKDDTRFRTVSAGRRFGKTWLAVTECLQVAMRGGRAWWIAPTYKMSNVGWRPIRQVCSPLDGVSVNKSERQAVFPGGGLVAVRSADNPDSLRGEGLDFVVMDEAAYIMPEAWIEAIRPALSDRLGRALFISTPRGRNWFWDIHRKGGAEPDWSSFTYPTSANPFMPKGEIEAARAELPEIIFRQEYLAEFVDSEGMVFQGTRRGHPATS